MKVTHLNPGYFILILAQIALSINFICSKLIISELPLTHLLFLRFLVGFLIITLLFTFSLSNEIKRLKSLSKRDLVLLVSQAICSGFLFNMLMMYGLQYTTVTTAGIINSTGPTFVLIFSVLLLKEHVNQRKIFAILCAAIGICLISIGKIDLINFSHTDLYGSLFLLLAMIPASLFSIFAKMMDQKLSPMILTCYINLINIFLFLPTLLMDVSGFDRFLDLPFSQWIYVLIYCITGGFLFFFLWYKGLTRTTANTASLFFGIMPLSTSIFAYLFLSENMTMESTLGMIFVILSIIVGVIHFELKIPSFNLIKRLNFRV